MTDPRTAYRPTRTKLQQAWHDMRRRCYDPKCNRYSRYGARGITICDEWRDNFEAFREWSLRNGFADGLSIDRRDNDNGYSPDNCRWTTTTEQARTRSTTKSVSFRGETLTFREWSARVSIDASLLHGRIFIYGWTVERALTTPVQEKPRRAA